MRWWNSEFVFEEFQARDQSGKPFVFAGLRVATSTAFLLIVASELIAANEGLGYLIIYAQRTFNPTLMFSGVLMVAGMGFIVDRLLLALGRWLFAWQDKTGF